MKRLVYAAVLVLSLPAFLLGQVPSTGTDSVMVVPGPQYEAGGWWRFWWGDHYRDAWTTPIRAEVLDCSHADMIIGRVVATSPQQQRVYPQSHAR